MQQFFDKKSKKINISYQFKKNLLNGENFFQVPCKLYYNSKKIFSIFNAKKHDKNNLCYTNYVDTDHLLNLILDLQNTFLKIFKKIPFIAIVAKHGNPFGASFNWHKREISIKQAFSINKKAALGAEFICNFKISAELSKKIFFDTKRKQRKIDVVFAESFTKNALNIFNKRIRTNLLSDHRLKIRSITQNKNNMYKQINGGLIEQPKFNFLLNKQIFENLKLSRFDIENLILSWCIVSNSFFGGNEIAIVKNRHLLICSGGPSTIESLQIAMFRLKKLIGKINLKNSYFAADAFFPYYDCLRQFYIKGIKKGLVPEGSINDNIIKKFILKKKMKIVFLEKKIRGFCRH